MRRALSACLAARLALAGGLVSARGPGQAKSRSAATTDPEFDDSNALMRRLLSSTDFQTGGLIYAASGLRRNGDGEGAERSVPGREYTRWGDVEFDGDPIPTRRPASLSEKPLNRI